MMADWPAETPEYWREVTEIINQNPPSDTFKTDWVVRKVPLYSKKMTSFDVIYLSDVLDFYDGSSAAAQSSYSQALQERHIGHNSETYADSVFSPSVRLTNLSVWTVKSFHHWMTLQKMAGSDVFQHYDHIIELGAGIGESARMVYDAFGYKGKYTIVDLPAVAQYSKKNLAEYPQVDFATDLSDINPSGRTLVFSTWGLSETELDFREKFFDAVGRCDIFVAFQAQIFGIDNRDYFVKYLPSKYLKNIRIRNIPMHTIDGGNFYMFAS
jgi:hypothetical protein